LALFVYLLHEGTHVLITFQHYHVTQRLVGTYSVGSKTKTKTEAGLRLVLS